ncbi:hypothetical protein [Streptomyces sp. NPDC091268]|uniref:hypothetical protein n=1 Tax=Streptomyces sp. NPDC091268 TaxID=3365979 RepID=UPI0038233009
MRGQEVLSAAQVCGGTLFTSEAAQALERVLQSSGFVVRTGRDNLNAEAMGAVMEAAYRAGNKVRDMPTGNCEISGKALRIEGDERYPSAQVRLTAFSKNAGIPAGESGASARGVTVSGAVRQRSVAFDCVSPRVDSTVDVPLRITATFRSRFDKGTVAEAELVEDYGILAHSAALAVAKELGCVSNGGLPDRAAGLPAPRE